MPIDWLEGNMKGEKFTESFDGISRRLRLVTQSRQVFEIRFRSQSDAAHLGHYLGEVLGSRSNGDKLVFRGFIATPKLHCWESVPSNETLRSVLLPRKSMPSDPPLETWATLLSPGHVRNSHELWQLLHTPGLQATPEEIGQLQRKVLDCVDRWNAEKVVAEESVEEVLQFLQIWRARLVERVGNWKEVMIDDPAIRWRLFEIAVGPTLSRELFGFCLLAASRNKPNTDLGCRIAQTLASLGQPPFFEEKVAELCSRDPFLNAILCTHWQLRANDDVQATLKRYQSRIGRVGNMVRLIRIMRNSHEIAVHPYSPEWITEECVECDSRQARLDFLWNVSRTEAGQSLLARAAGQDVVQSAVKGDIKEVLSHRQRVK